MKLRYHLTQYRLRLKQIYRANLQDKRNEHSYPEARRYIVRLSKVERQIEALEKKLDKYEWK